MVLWRFPVSNNHSENLVFRLESIKMEFYYYYYYYIVLFDSHFYVVRRYFFVNSIINLYEKVAIL